MKMKRFNEEVYTGSPKVNLSCFREFDELKVAQIWTFSSAKVGRAHHQTSTVFFKHDEKNNSRPKPC